MIRPALFFVCVCLSLPGTLAQSKSRQGWTQLFDGKDAGEWRGFRQAGFPGHIWAVKDGALYRRKAEGDLRRDLVTKRAFSDFELEFEWKIARGGNSGIKYLVRENRPASWERAAYRFRRNELIAQGRRDSEEFRALSVDRFRTSPIGFEFQILDDARNADAANGAFRQTGALYDLLPRMVNPSAPAEVYNRGRIIARGSRIQHWVNGAKMLDYDRGGTLLRRKIAESKFAGIPRFGRNRAGHITLQDHGDEVWFRQIRIRELR